MSVHVWGLDFHRSDSKEREPLYFDDCCRLDRVKDILSLGFSDLFYLQTCNRIEFYTTAQNFYCDTKTLWLKMLEYLNIPKEYYYRGYHYEGKGALRHLLKVSCSLESMAVGEAQILGQIKQTHQWTLDHNFPLSASLQSALMLSYQVAKKARTLTNIAKNPISLASIGVQKLEELEESSPILFSVVVGRGPMSLFFLKWLLENRKTPILWVNRTLSSLDGYLESQNVKTLALNEFLSHRDIPFSHLFTATSSPTPIFYKTYLDGFFDPKTFFDLAHPYDVESCETFHQVVRMEDLKEKAEKNILLRQEAVIQVEKIIEEALKDYYRQQKETPILKNFGEVEEKLNENLKGALTELKTPSSQVLDLERWGEKLLKKNLHACRQHLKTVIRQTVQDKLNM